MSAVTGLTASAPRLRYDTSLQRYEGRPSPGGTHTVFTVDAFLRNTGNGPAFLPSVSITMPAGAALDSGETAKKPLAPIPGGDSVRVSWRCIATGFARDSLVTFAVIARDDSSGVQKVLTTDLLIEANPALQRTVILCIVDQFPKDTLRYIEALKDYEGEASLRGAYTVFTVMLRMSNKGAFTARNIRVLPDANPFLVLDTTVGTAPDTLRTNFATYLYLKYRALPDTVARIADICFTVTSSNADTVKTCAHLFIEKFPLTPSTGLPQGEEPDFTLAQNHPNPFKNYTTISYGLAAASSVVLTVHDLIGREVARLVDDVKEPGRYTVPFDAGGLAAGIYIYRLRTGRFVATKKILLLK